MARYEITEIGNGPWCDPIEAADMDAALQIVRTDLLDANPVDYVDTYEDGDDLPTVDVSVRDIDTDESITRTLAVGR